MGPPLQDTSPCLEPNLPQREKMQQADSRELVEFVDLSGSRRAWAMIYWKFSNREAVPVDARNELPPKALLHGAKLTHQHVNNVLANQNVGATGILQPDAVEKVIDVVKSAREHFPKKSISAIHSPSEHDIRFSSNFPETAKIPRVALAIGIQA